MVMAGGTRLHTLRQSARGFTLVEIMVVMAVIAILAAIALAVQDGLRERGLRTKAQGQLADLAQALEQYRILYGDYPWVPGGDDGSRALYAALIGQTTPKGDQFRDGPNGPIRKRQHFIDIFNYTVGDENGALTAPPKTIGEGVDMQTLDADFARHHFLDPWGRPYRYAYKSRSDNGAAWKHPGFILLSDGGDGKPPMPLPANGWLPANYRDQPGAADDLILNQ